MDVRTTLWWKCCHSYNFSSGISTTLKMILCQYTGTYKGTGGLAQVGKYYVMVDGGQLVISLVILVSDTGGPDVWSGVLCAVGRDNEEGGEYWNLL